MLKECRIVDKDKKVRKCDIAIEITRNESHVLSPSWEIINEWKHDKDIEDIDIAWSKFTNNFISELNTITVNNEIDNLVELAIKLDNDNNDLYLMCYENTNKYCHRFIVKELIDKQIEKLGEYKQNQNTLSDFM